MAPSPVPSSARRGKGKVFRDPLRTLAGSDNLTDRFPEEKYTHLIHIVLYDDTGAFIRNKKLETEDLTLFVLSLMKSSQLHRNMTG